jgi:hypothetical protein
MLINVVFGLRQVLKQPGGELLVDKVAAEAGQAAHGGGPELVAALRALGGSRSLDRAILAVVQASPQFATSGGGRGPDQGQGKGKGGSQGRGQSKGTGQLQGQGQGQGQGKAKAKGQGQAATAGGARPPQPGAGAAARRRAAGGDLGRDQVERWLQQRIDQGKTDRGFRGLT